MSLAFNGPGGSVEIRWIEYALIRDNVQHHLEGGVPGERFSTLHAISATLGGRGTQLPAAALHEELMAVQRELATLPRAKFAISMQTLAAMSHVWPPRGEGTALVRDLEAPYLDEGAATLGELVGPVMASLVDVTAGGGDGAVVEVFDV